MKTLQFTVAIAAKATKVYDLMLGLTDKASYEQWTATFNPTSTYQGDWTQGGKMLFIGVDEQGAASGLVSTIAVHHPAQFVSIQHLGLYQSGREITTGPDVEKWANGFENYTFEEKDGSTLLTVDLDTSEEFQSFMQETYPQALDKLKEICES